MAEDGKRREAGEAGASLSREACALCGTLPAHRLFPARDRLHGVPGEFWIVRCRECGLLRTSPRPTGAALAAYYPEDYAPHAEAGDAAPAEAGERREGLAGWLRRHGASRRIWWTPELWPGARVLELGSGAGHFVRHALARGWDVHALEPAGAPAERLARDPRVTVHRGPAEALDLQPRSFDAVFAWMVVEHLEDPAAVLRKVAAALRPGGYFVFSIPNAASWERRAFRTHWYALDAPRHLWHFTPRTLARLLGSCGLALERIFHQKTLKNVGGSLDLLAAARPGAAWLARPLARLVSRPAASFLLGAALAGLRQGGRLTVVARAGAPAGSIRILLHKPLVRMGEPYFRVQQYVDALQRLGHRPTLLDFGRLEGSAARRLLGVAGQLGASLAAFGRHDVAFITPHPLAWLYILLARVSGCRIVVDQILTYLSHREVLPWFPRGIDAWMYRSAAGILTHSETMRRGLCEGFGADPARVHVAYPVLDLGLFSRRWEAEAAALRRELGLGPRFVVLYHGMWHPWHGVPHIYEAARLLEHRRDIVFVLMPKAGEPRPNLLVVDEQPFARLPAYLQMADAWASGFDSDARGERAFSSTLIQALALGLPVVTGRAGERAARLRDGVDARFVPLRDPPAIAEALVRLADDRPGARAMGERARAFAEAHFAIENLDRALAALLDGLARRPSGPTAGG